jgi:hypothetical protein
MGVPLTPFSSDENLEMVYAQEEQGRRCMLSKDLFERLTAAKSEPVGG